MEMDKTKVILFSGIGLAVLLVGYMFFRAASKKENETGDKVEVSSKVEDKYTYKEMMAANSAKNVNGDYDTLGNYTVPSYGGGSVPPSTPPQEQATPQSADEARLNEALTHVKENKSNSYYEDENTAEVRRVQKQILQQNKPQVKSGIPVVSNRPPVTYTASTRTEIAEAQGEPTRKGKVLFFDNDGGEGETKTKGTKASLLQAVTHGDQSVTDGGTIKLRTTQDATINDTFLPRNTLVYGSVRFENNRITVQVNSIKKDGGNVYVNLLAYDQRDGRAGLNVEGGNFGNDLKDAGEQAGDEATSRVDNMPVVGTVSRGVKQIFSNKRNRSQSILIGSNYKLFLK